MKSKALVNGIESIRFVTDGHDMNSQRLEICRRNDEPRTVSEPPLMAHRIRPLQRWLTLNSCVRKKGWNNTQIY